MRAILPASFPCSQVAPSSRGLHDDIRARLCCYLLAARCDSTLRSSPRSLSSALRRSSAVPDLAAAWGGRCTATPKPADATDGERATRLDPPRPGRKAGLAEWMERCIKGNTKYLAHDIPGAIDLYRQAIQLAPKRPLLPRYLVGRGAARRRANLAGGRAGA